jgi:hypothetical protein
VREPSRREALRWAAGAGLTLAGPGAGVELDNVIAKENGRAGTKEWMLTKPRVDKATKYRCPWIEGFCSRTSVRHGEKIAFYVSTNPASKYALTIYRLGYYGGAGGREMARYGPLHGTVQPDPPTGDKRYRDCRWALATELTVPSDWVSGVYLGKLTAANDGTQSYLIFIVRDDRMPDPRRPTVHRVRRILPLGVSVRLLGGEGRVRRLLHVQSRHAHG